MKFADFYPGRIIQAGPYLLEQAEVLAFARAYDPQWFHTNVSAAASGPFGGLIASGWHTCSIAMRLIADAALHQSEGYASPGVEQIRWPHPVRPGDRLTLTATVIENRRSTTKPERGIVRWRWQLHNQDAVEVLNLIATSFFDLKPAAQLG